MSSKIKYILSLYPSLPALLVSLLETFKRHKREPTSPITLGKWELSCLDSQWVWLPCFWVESKRIKSTGALLESGRENKTKHNETTVYVHEKQMNSSSSWQYTAKADGSFRPKSLSVAGFKDIKFWSSNTSLQSDSGSGRGSSPCRLDPWRAELPSLPLTHGLLYPGHPLKHQLPSWRAKDFNSLSILCTE